MTQNIFITGAARGIGLELARQYANRGDTVTGLVRAPDSEFDHIKMLTGDVTDRRSLKAAARTFPCDLLVCNAGVYLDKELALEDNYGTIWAQSFAVNVEGVFNTVQAFLGAKKPPAKIAIISSIMASSSNARGGAYVYRASKAAATNLARNLAADLEPRGIAVGAYHPGWVQTDMGGPQAAIDVQTSARGLIARFDALDMNTTGVFEGYDGTPMAF